MRNSTSPAVVPTVFGNDPLREFACNAASGSPFSSPTCSVSSTCDPRLRAPLLIPDVLGQLGLQPPPEAGLDQLLDEPPVPVELHLARVDLREQIIQHPGLDQTLSALRLNLAPLITRRLVDNQQCVSFRKETHPLHTPFDTLPQSDGSEFICLPRSWKHRHRSDPEDT